MMSFAMRLSFINYFNLTRFKKQLTFFQAEIYIGLSQWSKAESLLWDTRNPIGLYQLSQALLEQRKMKEARRVAKKGAKSLFCHHRKRRRKNSFCGRFFAQEADILLQMGHLRGAAKVSSYVCWTNMEYHRLLNLNLVDTNASSGSYCQEEFFSS